MPIQEALRLGVEQLAGRYGQGPEPRLLLAFALGKSQSYVLAHGEETLAAATLATYLTHLHRAEQGEPIPYILGTAPFFDFTLKVTPAVLIPRPETEQLVEMAVKWIRQHNWPGLRVVDVGTGSGCIAIALARRLPQLQVNAVDLSHSALELAKENAIQCGVGGQITFYWGSLLEPIPGQLDLLVANLPYVLDEEWTCLDDGVKSYEPALALRGGVDGLDVIRALLVQAQTKLAQSGAIFLEIGWQQGAAAAALAQQFFPHASVSCRHDYAGKDRFIVIELI